MTAAPSPDAPGQPSLLVEGWRAIPHSYAITNQFQGLDLAARPGLRFAYRDLPYPQTWRPATGLFDPDREQAIRAFPAPRPGERFDAALRIAFPFDFSQSPDARRTLVFGTAEWREVAHLSVAGRVPLATALARSDALVVTSSRWSRDGFLSSGAPPERVVVVPLGVDTGIYHPVPDEDRMALRRKLGLNGFTFLTAGAMTTNKGVGLLLKAFAAVLERHPEAMLLAKGLDDFYRARDNMLASARNLSERERERIRPRFLYLGKTLSFHHMAGLYQAADAYVSPYLGEGFNMPVLEAAASGLPVICTRGGSTDDFTTPDFALHIDSRTAPIVPYAQFPDVVGTALHPDLDHLIALMTQAIEQPDIAARARRTGPAFAAAGFTWRHTGDRLLRAAFGEPGVTEGGLPTG